MASAFHNACGVDSTCYASCASWFQALLAKSDTLARHRQIVIVILILILIVIVIVIVIGIARAGPLLLPGPVDLASRRWGGRGPRERYPGERRISISSRIRIMSKDNSSEQRYPGELEIKYARVLGGR